MPRKNARPAARKRQQKLKAKPERKVGSSGRPVFGPAPAYGGLAVLAAMTAMAMKTKD